MPCLGMSTVKIENNTSRILLLPPLDGWETGMKLLPGLNSVPLAYYEALNELSVTPAPLANGTPRPVRFPGREALSLLQQPVLIQTLEGRRHGPQITIFSAEQVEREDGPVLPGDLAGYKPDVAIALVRTTSDRKVLRQWAKDSRQDVKAAVLARLQDLA